MNDLKLLRKDNNEQEKSLFKDNHRIVTDMVVYLHSSDVDEYDIEIIRKDLIGMAVESQLRGEDFSAVIGQDYQSFCDQLIESSCKKRSAIKILDFIFIAAVTTGVMIIIDLFAYWEMPDKHAPMYHMPVTWGFIISTLIVIMIVNGTLYFVSRNSFKLSGEHSNKISNLFGLLLILGILTAGLARYLFRSAIIGTVNYIYPLIIVAFGIIVIKLSDTISKNKNA